MRGLRIHRHGHPRVAFVLREEHAYTFGRTTRAQILLPDIRVSRCHGELMVRNGAWTYTDLGSANGSYVFDVEDLHLAERAQVDLRCYRLAVQEGYRLRPGEGVLLGCRDAWIELTPTPPAGALPDLVGINPPSVLAVLGIEAVREADTPDLEWTSEALEPPPPRVLDLLDP
ncbi:MAG: FHA domain-containing protein [Myxococcota bacterium]